MIVTHERIFAWIWFSGVSVVSSDVIHNGIVESVEAREEIL